jgi:radical SAM protein with 4Fe4S-binding SPASM domain
LFDITGAADLLPDDSRYRRYHVAEDGRLMVKRRLLNRCGRLWHTAVVTSDGDLVPCCFDKEATLIMGSLKDRSLREVWREGMFMSFRRKILEKRASVDICRNCTGGLGRIILR